MEFVKFNKGYSLTSILLIEELQWSNMYNIILGKGFKKKQAIIRAGDYRKHQYV